jgi:hypothetical protein
MDSTASTNIIQWIVKVLQWITIDPEMITNASPNIIQGIANGLAIIFPKDFLNGIAKASAKILQWMANGSERIVERTINTSPKTSPKIQLGMDNCSARKLQATNNAPARNLKGAAIDSVKSFHGVTKASAKVLQWISYGPERSPPKKSP